MAGTALLEFLRTALSMCNTHRFTNGTGATLSSMAFHIDGDDKGGFVLEDTEDTTDGMLVTTAPNQGINLPKAAVTIVQRTKAYWDNVANVVTNLAPGNIFLGYFVKAALVGDARVDVEVVAVDLSAFKWQGLLVQAADGVPVLTELHNALNVAAPAIARTGAGAFTLTFASAVLTAGKVAVTVSLGADADVGITASGNAGSTTVVNLESALDAVADDYNGTLAVTIEVYP